MPKHKQKYAAFINQEIPTKLQKIWTSVQNYHMIDIWPLLSQGPHLRSRWISQETEICADKRKNLLSLKFILYISEVNIQNKIRNIWCAHMYMSVCMHRHVFIYVATQILTCHDFLEPMMGSSLDHSLSWSVFICNTLSPPLAMHVNKLVNDH